MAESKEPPPPYSPPPYSPTPLEEVSTPKKPVYKAVSHGDFENLEDYAPGGYCPVVLGDKFVTESGTIRHIVLAKLGYGPSSTVWLVKREANTPPTISNPTNPSFHALKILRAELSVRDKHNVIVPEQQPGYQMMRRLEQVGWRCHAHPNMIQIQSSFTRRSPNGQHCCYLLPLLGLSLDRCLNSLDGKQRHRICKQLAHVVNYLHTFAVCHGDLSPQHVLFRIPGAFDNLRLRREDDLDRFLGPHCSQRVEMADGSALSQHAPRVVYEPARFTGISMPALRDVALVGFGKAFATFRTPPTLHCPIPIYPPEVLFGQPPSTKSDIWQLGCLFFKIHTGSFPFLTQTSGLSLDSSYERLVWSAVQYLGPVPNSWKSQYRCDLYNDLIPPGQMDRQDLECWFDAEQPTKSLEDRLKEAKHLGPKWKRNRIARLLSMMFAWEPSQRPSAGSVWRQLSDPPLEN
ncbi:hypothetical protein C8A03DRAFT_15491 [Achaetomium macrosporum]|uniref:Protein kinase domain-containing protein n=1 Tax=Achaetomium macrosporum TaxID=79813 RepID=A0AAN7H6Z3_9PEZI|nr:hypothetical protein C8A03DRAFT_15491 [Achaetomium macrosporum]